MKTTRRPHPAARKSLGQHFLHDAGVLADIAAAVHPPPGGTLIEIGPGTGELTAALLATHPTVSMTALELDSRMLDHLARRFPEEPRLRLLEGDARDTPIADLVEPGRPYAVAGNLPYFAASPIIRRFLENEPRPETIVAMLQREVANEIAAPEGSFSLLTLATRIYATAELLFTVPPEAFRPPPKVTSAVVRLTTRPEPLVPPERLDAFFKLVTRTFRNPRKQLHNALASGTWVDIEQGRIACERAGIECSRRPGTIAIAEWLALLDVLDEMRADA